MTGVIELESLTEDAKELSIKVADQKVTVPLEEIAALAFSPSLFSEVSAELLCKLALMMEVFCGQLNSVVPMEKRILFYHRWQKWPRWTIQASLFARSHLFRIVP